jgi:hypothetical protein
MNDLVGLILLVVVWLVVVKFVLPRLGLGG